jgi:hypothetical protein
LVTLSGYAGLLALSGAVPRPVGSSHGAD